MMRRRTSTLGALTMLLGILVGCGSTNLQSATIAQVGNTNITEAQFTTSLERAAQGINDFLAQSGSADSANQVRQIIFDNIVKEEVALNEARAQGYGITSKDIESFQSSIDAQITGGQGLPTIAQRDAWAKTSSQVGAESFADYETIVRRQVALDNYAQHVFVADLVPLALYRQIVIASDPDPNATKVQADDVVRQLRAGASFGDLAQQYSIDPTAAAGGDVEAVDVRLLSPELSTLVQSLPLNTISDPILLPQGWTIIEVRVRRPYNATTGTTAFVTWNDMIQTPEGQAYIAQKVQEYTTAGKLEYYADPAQIPFPASIKQP